MPLMALSVSIVLCCFLLDSMEHAVFFKSSINYSI